MVALTTEATAIFAKAKDEARELNADEIKRKDEIFGSLKGIKATMDSEKELAGFAFEKMDKKTVSNDVKAAFYKYLRTGQHDNFVISTGSGGGALLPKEVEIPALVRRPWNAWLQALSETGNTPIYTDGTESISIPVLDDTANSGQVLTENAPTTTSTDPNIPALVLGQTLYNSQPTWVTNTQLGANTFDLESYVLKILQKRIDLVMDSAWTTIALALADGGNTVTTATTTGLTFPNVESFYHKLPYQFRTDGVFIMSDGTAQLLEGLSDNNGRPLINMQDSISGGVVRTLKGCPVVLSPSLAAPAAGVYGAIFVSAESIKVRLVKNTRIARYVNVPIDAYKDMTGLEQFQNGDMNLSPGYAFLKFAAS